MPKFFRVILVRLAHWLLKISGNQVQGGWSFSKTPEDKGNGRTEETSEGNDKTRLPNKVDVLPPETPILNQTPELSEKMIERVMELVMQIATRPTLPPPPNIPNQFQLQIDASLETSENKSLQLYVEEGTKPARTSPSKVTALGIVFIYTLGVILIILILAQKS